ncbi:La domain-containing protein [Cephalotus follicularis]|uniref:La domain-containing protein n=1 Tax=Cephalotus follicularis TaxID=3775 RepID=A0A1Q3BH21_CEPFO|nr:La domain-containing protein [Cephalotus follicularis]
MAQQESDPCRNASLSRLNAQAPAFVPTRNSTQPPPPPRLLIPPPPVMHVYHPPPPPPFHVPIHGHVIHHLPNHLHNNHHRTSNTNSYSYSHTDHNHNHDHNPDGGNGDQQEFHNGGIGDQDSSSLKILNQVEYYFSDLNLATTDHLMRFISKDPEGFVPISVVASFKKIKALISGHSQLAGILRNSSKLVVSDDGKKIRRQHPITESDFEELQSRIVVAENLPEDHCHQNLMKIFSAVGSVKTIRTCQPQTSGSSGGSLASRSAKADNMHFSNKLHAFVEYESVELAEKAVAELNDEANWRSGLRVCLMLRRTSKPAQLRGRKVHEGDRHNEENDTSASEQTPNEKQTEDSSQKPDVYAHQHTAEENVNDKEGGQRKGRSKGRVKGRGRAQHPHNNHHNNRGNHLGTPPSSIVFGNDQPTLGKQPPGPRMPDGTRGFSMGRGKPVAVNTA